MNDYQTYAIETMVNGWTRIDMLLALYDRTIASAKLTQQLYQTDDTTGYALASLETNKLLLGLHGGLDVEKYPLAGDVARLLNFIILRFAEKNFDEAIQFLEKLQNSFEQIRDEASELEKAGKLPALNATAGLNTVA